MGAPGDSSEAPDLSVVVLSGDESALEATLTAVEREAAAVEVVLARRWRSGDAGAARTRAREVWHASANAAAAVNAGIAAARAPVVLLLAAGDVPRRPGFVAEHLAAHRNGASVVAGAVEPVRDDWVGNWPAGVPGFASRHISLSGGPRAEGLDDRCPDLDVAAIELLARVGNGVAWRADLAVSGAPGDPEEAGRAAHVLVELCKQRGIPLSCRGPRRARVLLRWARPALRERLARRADFARGLGLPRLPITDQDRAGVPAPPPEDRPAISVIVPFAGTRAEADAVFDALTAIDRRPGDELIVADNSVDPVLEPRGDVRVVRADKERSSYSARNAAAATASGEWLLFTDSDCVPAPWLLDAYWAPPPAEVTGAVAGSIVNPPAHGWAERYSADADVLSQARSLNHPYKPYGVTANLLVRRAAWERVGGFAEGARSGGDAEFCWRIQHDGWEIEHRPHAAVIHFHRTTLNGILRQYRRYGAGVAWLERRYPGATHGWPALPPHWLRGPLIDIAAARPRAAAKRAIDVLCVLAAVRGSREPNRPPPWPTR